MFLDDDKEVTSNLLELEESHLNLEKAMSKLSFDIEEEKYLFKIAIESVIQKKIILENKECYSRSSKWWSIFKSRVWIILRAFYRSIDALSSYRTHQIPLSSQ